MEKEIGDVPDSSLSSNKSDRVYGYFKNKKLQREQEAVLNDLRAELEQIRLKNQQRIGNLPQDQFKLAQQQPDDNEELNDIDDIPPNEFTL